MTAEELATEEFVDREIAHIRTELGHVRELWEQQSGAEVAALLIRTVEIERRLADLNHAHAQAREVAATTVDSARYDEQTAELHVQIQAVKDTASGALLVAVADIARQLAVAHAQVVTNKEEIVARFVTLRSEVEQDFARRAGASDAISAEARKAAGRAWAIAVISTAIAVLGFVATVFTFVRESYGTGVTP